MRQCYSRIKVCVCVLFLFTSNKIISAEWSCLKLLTNLLCNLVLPYVFLKKTTDYSYGLYSRTKQHLIFSYSLTEVYFMHFFYNNFCHQVLLTFCML